MPTETPALPITGRCQCDKVHYQVTEPFLYQYVCHCTDCQKLTSSAYSTAAGIKPGSLQIIKGESINYPKKADSGRTVNCYFCSGCGNRIYHQSQEMPEVIRLKTGTLDDTGLIKPELHVWLNSKLSWVTIDESVPQYDTQPDY